MASYEPKAILEMIPRLHTRITMQAKSKRLLGTSAPNAPDNLVGGIDLAYEIHMVADRIQKSPGVALVLRHTHKDAPNGTVVRPMDTWEDMVHGLKIYTLSNEHPEDTVVSVITTRGPHLCHRPLGWHSSGRDARCFVRVRNLCESVKQNA